jgi:hypothetical protein
MTMTITRRRFLHTIGHGGAAASLMGGALAASWQARNAFAQAQLPGPLRIHGNPIGTREKI